ncbi:MAG: hypothetical protein H6656_18060 [Ardenticatenaceae bacterium]|nr:hypothetical protein [Anaerolineales bacterium]MCB9009234.1 hypothetical protein [Ardenticatenaceae bacterium]
MDFNEWLLQQVERNDAIGKFAKQIVNDPTGPMFSIRPGTFRAYLIERKVDTGTMEAFEVALAEWATEEEE